MDTIRNSTGTATADPSQVRAQLERLLTSPHLRNSRRCQSLLKFVVEAVLEGAPDRVKERTLGVQVFGREPEYDTNHDSVVRNAAIEVRKRLAQYYMEPGHQSEMRIALPLGGYVPEFHVPVAQPNPPQADELTPPLPHRRNRMWLAAIAAVPCALAAIWLLTPSAQTELARFWAPLVEDRAGVLICVGQPARVYTFTDPRRAELDEKMGTGPSAIQQPPEVLTNTPLTLHDVTRAGRNFLYFGDTICVAKVSGFLQSRNKASYVRRAGATSYQDLRGSPAVLIGIFNNTWTQRLTGGFRYYFVRLPELHRDELRDRQNPGKAPWVVPSERSEEMFDDYAIVSRMLDPSTEKAVVTIAGVTQSGTQSAGDFITNADYIRQAFQNAPSGWQRKNIQIVLKTRIVTGAAGPPQVVATHFW